MVSFTVARLDLYDLLCMKSKTSVIPEKNQFENRFENFLYIQSQSLKFKSVSFITKTSDLIANSKISFLFPSILLHNRI